MRNWSTEKDLVAIPERLTTSDTRSRARGGVSPRDAEGDLLVRRGPAARAIHECTKFLFRVFAVLLFDLRIFGARRAQRAGPLVVASNHQSFLDPALLGICLPQRAYYLARDSLFRVPLFGRYISALNALPIPRGTAASRRGIDLGRAVMRAGSSLILFPEGTRSRDGKMGPVKRGVDLVTRPTGAGVVPAFIDGSFEAWPRGGWLRARPIRIFFGTPFEAGARNAEGKEIDDDDPRPATGGHGTCADLVTRLSASYRSLEAHSRRVRLAGAARRRGWPHYSG
jgi:1-acyl-sn-glycerol-3-phosphate acyltransferase